MALKLIILLFQFSTQYGIMTVINHEWKQIGYISVYNKILWVKFDYEKAEQFEVVFTEKRGESTIYYVKNEKAQGYIRIDTEIYIDLFKINKERYNKTFKTRKI